MKFINIILLALLLLLSACTTKADKQTKNEVSMKNPIATMETSLGNIKIELLKDIAPKTVDNFIGLAEGTKEWTDPKTGEKVKKPFYDGLIFHRVISEFMIQGGCPLGNGTGGPGYSFEDECFDGSGKIIEGKITTPEMAEIVLNEMVIPFIRANQTTDEGKQLIDIVTKCQKEQSYTPFMANDLDFYKKLTGFSKELREHGKVKAPVDYGTLCMANSGPNTNGSQFFIVTKKDGTPWLNGKHTVFGKVIEGMDIALKIEAVKKNAQDKPETPVVINKVTIQ